MEVILVEDMEKLGRKGDIVKVKDGYYRNYLFPRKKAVPCTKENLRWQEQEKARRAEQDAKEREEAVVLAKKLEKIVLEIKAHAGENDKLYGSVSSREIALALSEKKIVLEEGKIEIETPIKILGDHQVKLKLHADVSSEICVRVVKDKSQPESGAQG
ncbi:MAG TPA: 50S ribosomal protein L9 [Candidatus Omnitrophota bacterium]|mgnify:CR=1 FL=1|nr:50S ribosomal protein L9 [Candidatus Omnitrophota bacterium]